MKKVFSVESGIFLMGVLLWVASYVSNLGYGGEPAAFSKVFLGCCILVYGLMLLYALDSPRGESESTKFKKFLVGMFAVFNMLASVVILIGGY